MKKLIFYLLICSIILCACSAADKENGSSNSGVNMTTGSAVTTAESTVTAAGVAATVSGAAVDKKQQKKEKKKIVRIVTDETGKQQELKLESVNTKKKGMYFSSASWITNYSQVEDGHYYYIRENETGIYTIYQDKKKKVGEFSVKEYSDNDFYPQPIGAVKYKEKLYILFDFLGDNEEDDLLDDFREGKMASVDLKNRKVMPLWDMSRNHLADKEGIVFCNFYEDFLYYDSRSYWDAEYNRPGTLVKSPMESKKSRETITTTKNLAKAKPYLTYIDGKIYYGVQKGKKVTLYSHDLQSGQEEKIFCYMRNDDKKTTIFLQMDEEYIYCQEYLIPRCGGKMIKAFADAKVFKSKPHDSYSIRSISYSYNKKYIFYVDKNYKVHRIDKKTGQNRIISNLKAAGVDCTEDSVYVKVHAKAWYNKKGMWKELYDDDEGLVSYNCYSHHLYCMGIDGRNIEKIWNGGWQ